MESCQRYMERGATQWENHGSKLVPPPPPPPASRQGQDVFCAPPPPPPFFLKEWTPRKCLSNDGVTLSWKSSLILGENKAAFPREGHDFTNLRNCHVPSLHFSSILVVSGEIFFSLLFLSIHADCKTLRN